MTAARGRSAARLDVGAACARRRPPPPRPPTRPPPRTAGRRAAALAYPPAICQGVVAGAHGAGAPPAIRQEGVGRRQARGRQDAPARPAHPAGDGGLHRRRLQRQGLQHCGDQARDDWPLPCRVFDHLCVHCRWARGRGEAQRARVVLARRGTARRGACRPFRFRRLHLIAFLPPSLSLSLNLFLPHSLSLPPADKPTLHGRPGLGATHSSRFIPLH